ncbi:MAG: response regulator [Mariprofundus sp.]|nr:response regulator [Mariprofundus sp.]
MIQKRVTSFSIEPELLRLLFAQAPPSFAASTIGAVVLAFVLWDVVNHGMLGAWLLLMIAVNGMRFLLAYRFRYTLDTPLLSPRWHQLFALSTACIGAIWGMGAVLFMQQVELPYQMFIALMIVGMVAGAIASYTPSIIVYSVFVLPVMLPSGLWLLFQGSKIDLAMGIMGLLFTLVMWIIARQQHQTLVENMGLQSEKEELIKQLQHSTLRHVRAQQLARLGHWELDLIKNTLLWSDEVYRIFEIDPKQLGQSYEAFLEAIHPDDRAIVDKAYTTSLQAHAAYDIEHRLLFPDGRIKWVHETCESEYTVDGTPIRSIGSVQDITERITFEEEREQMQVQVEHMQRLESLGVLAGGIAHDFNNILTAIMCNAAMAERKALTSPQDTQRYLGNIVASSGKAAELCKQMLAYSGKGQFVLKTIDLSSMVKEITKLLEISIGKNVVMKYHLSEHQPVVEVDVAQIQQVIMNLVINASDAIGEKSGVISISTGVMQADCTYLAATSLDDSLPEGRYVYLEVSDTGCGMDKETQTKLFEPFFTTKITGHGLGMSAVLGIVRGHQGAIKLYSKLGKGSSFKFLLPISCQPVEAIAEQTTPGDDWRGAGTVLIVDDEETIRETAVMMLEEMGFTTLCTVDGEDGVRVYREHQSEIVAVLMDMTMPKMDGKACFTELRRINKHVKVVLSSGYNEQEAISRFNGQGLAGFIQKPYLPDKLIDIMYTTTSSNDAHLQ